VFGPQKGATPAMVDQLDAALATLRRRHRGATLASTSREIPGAGAGGGIAPAMIVFLNGDLKRPGSEIVIDAVGSMRWCAKPTS
jgi:glycerate kinase